MQTIFIEIDKTLVSLYWHMDILRKKLSNQLFSKDWFNMENVTSFTK